jgi:hypothetical protein
VWYSKEHDQKKTTPYTPQQNGFVNKTSMEKARSMLSGTELGQEFWAEAVDTACYLINLSPSSRWMKKLHTRYGLKRNHLFNILECLIMMLMYIFQRKIGVSWIKKLKSESLLVINMVRKVISFGTQKLRRLFAFGMFFLER